MPMAWVMMPMTLPNVVPRMRLGMTMPMGMGMVTDAEVRKNCGLVVIVKPNANVVEKRLRTNS